MARCLTVLLTLLALAPAAAAQTPCGGFLQPMCPAPAPEPSPEPSPPVASPEPDPEPQPDPGPSAEDRDRQVRAAVRRVYRVPASIDTRLRRLLSDPSIVDVRKAIRLFAKGARAYGRAAKNVAALEGGSADVRAGLKALTGYYRVAVRAYGLYGSGYRELIRTRGAQGEAKLDRAVRLARAARPARLKAQRLLGVPIPK